MAVDLRCPECRYVFHLPTDPEPDSEMECPECGHVYPCEKNIAYAGSDDEDRPRKKKKAAGGDGGGVKTKTDKKAKKEKAAAPEQAKGPKKRKMKKRKTPPAVIATIVVGVLMFVGTVGGVLIWFFTKKSASQEMMTYLPDDCDEVFGLNIGHLQKYPKFYEACVPTFANSGMRKAGDLLAKALGQDFDSTIDYVVQGTDTTTVFRTKDEIDQGAIANIPGARKYTANGVDYYTIPDIRELGYPGLRVFAPTNRIVVFCAGTIPQAKFNAMLTGNKDNLDATVFARAGALAKQTIRGTVWKFSLYGRSIARPSGPTSRPSADGQVSDEDQLKTEIAAVAASAQGSGYKASVGSRDVRGEWILWYQDAAAAADAVKKWKEKEWIKDSDEKDPPKWWKILASKSGGGKMAANILRDNLSFRSSGELFSIRSEMETKLLQQGVGSLVSAFNPQAGGVGPGGGPPGGGAGMPGAGGLPGPGGGVPMGGGMPRRRRFAASPIIPV